MVLLPVIEQHMGRMHESSVNPAPTPRTAIRNGSGRPNDPFKHLQYVDLTLDDKGKCHLSEQHLRGAPGDGARRRQQPRRRAAEAEETT